MKVKVMKRNDPPPPVNVLSKDDAIHQARQYAQILAAYGLKFPRIREDGSTYTIDAYDGLRLCGHYRPSTDITLDGCARLLAKSKQLAAASEASEREFFSKFAPDVAEVMISGQARPGNFLETIRAIVEAKEKELLAIFETLKMPQGINLRLRLTYPIPCYISIDERDKFLHGIGRKVSEQRSFLENFELIKKSFLEAREALSKLKNDQLAVPTTEGGDDDG